MRQAITVAAVHTHTHEYNLIKNIEGEKAFIIDDKKDRL